MVDKILGIMPIIMPYASGGGGEDIALTRIQAIIFGASIIPSFIILFVGVLIFFLNEEKGLITCIIGTSLCIVSFLFVICCIFFNSIF